MTGFYQINRQDPRNFWQPNANAPSDRNQRRYRRAPPICPSLNPDEEETRLRQRIEHLFNNQKSKEEISGLLSHLYYPVSLKTVQTVIKLGSGLKEIHNLLCNFKEHNHGPLTKALRDGCSKETVLDLYQSQVVFTENLLSLVILRDEALRIFPDMLEKYTGSGKPLRNKFVEQACEYKRPMLVTKTLIESFKNPNEKQVCDFFSAALYYEYYKTEPEILPYLLSKFTKTHEQSVLKILRDLTDDFQFTHALPKLPSLVISFIKEGGNWTSELIESVLDNRISEDANVLVEVMIASKKPISEEDLEIALRLCASEDALSLLLSAFLERGGKASSRLLKTSLSSPYASITIAERMILKLVEEQGCLTKEQVNMPTDYYFGKEKQDLLLIYALAGTTISL